MRVLIHLALCVHRHLAAVNLPHQNAYVLEYAPEWLPTNHVSLMSVATISSVSGLISYGLDVLGNILGGSPWYLLAQGHYGLELCTVLLIWC